MTEFKVILEKLAQRQDLHPHEAADAMQSILQKKVGIELTTAFLLGMRAKGETIEEYTAFVKVMRDAAIRPEVDIEGAVDLCGTGGDSSGTFNISTASMFVVGGAGVPVLKHGNRSVSSKSGSADVLEELGIVATLHKEQVEQVFEATNMAFLFAPYFHPAMKQVMPARNVLGIRSFFNTMGPLLNPAGVKRQVVGAFDQRTAHQIAEILGNLQSEHTLSVHARDGLDEVSLCAPTFVYELYEGEVYERPAFDAASLGYKTVGIHKLQGKNAAFNAGIIRSIMEGKATDAQRNIVVINASFGILVSGKAENLEEAHEMALESIDSGAALRKLDQMAEVTNDVMQPS